MTHRPYILESDIIDILFLSFFHPSTYPYILIASQLIIQFVFPFFFLQYFTVAIMISPIDSILIGSLDPHNAER